MYPGGGGEVFEHGEVIGSEVKWAVCSICQNSGYLNRYFE